MINIHIKAETTLADAKAVVDRNIDVMREHVQNKLKEYGMPPPVCDLGFGVNLTGYPSPYDDIINIANHIQNALATGWFLFFEAEQLRRELAELKGREIKAAEYQVIEPAAEDAPPETSKGVTLGDICDLTAEVTKADADNRLKILKRLGEIGAKSITMLKDEHFADFFEFLRSLRGEQGLKEQE